MGQDAACPGGLFTGWLERKLTFPWMTSKCPYLLIFIFYIFHVSTGKNPPTTILSYLLSNLNSEKVVEEVVRVLSFIASFEVESHGAQVDLKLKDDPEFILCL